MISLVRFSVQRPRLVICIAILTTLAVAPGLVRLRLHTDGNALLPHQAPEVKHDRSIRKAFGIRDQLIVLVSTEHPEGIFNTHTLDLVRELTDRIGGMKGVDRTDITSLATERGDRVVPGTLNFRTFLEPPPRTQADLRRVRNDLRQIKLYIGTLVSFDERSTCIFVGVPDEVDRVALYGRLRNIIAELGDIPETVEVVGAPAAESLLGTHILEDLGIPAQWSGLRDFRTEEIDSSTAIRPAFRMRKWIGRHIGLLPLAILVMFLVLLVTFRSITAALLPLIEVGACLIFVFSMMGWSQTPIYLTVAVLPIILTAMAIADEIHIFTHYQQLLLQQSGAGRAALVEITMGEMWRPVVKTSITTVIAFLSFSLSPIRPVQVFGLFTAAGILFCMFWSLTVIPASLVLIPPRWFVSSKRGSSQASHVGLESLFKILGGVILRHRRLTLIIALAAIVITPWGLSRLLVQDSWIGGFAQDSAFYRATQKVNDGFRGTHILVVEVNTGGSVVSGVVDSDAVTLNRVDLPAEGVDDPAALVGRWLDLEPLEPPVVEQRDAAPKRRLLPKSPALIETAAIEGGRLVITTSRRGVLLGARYRRSDSIKLRFTIAPHGLLSQQVLQRLRDLEDFIEQRTDCAVGGVLGPCSYLATLNYTAHARKEAFRKIPERSDRILWLWHQYERVRGRQRLDQLIDEHHARCLITVFLKNANYRLTGVLLREIREYERQNLAPHGISLAFAGDVAVSQTMIGAIVQTQLRSLLLSIVGILLVTSILGRSLHWGLYCVLPCGLAVLINFALMGAMGMPLGVATSMFAAMTLGIGVDFAIHLLERYRIARSSGRQPDEATIHAIVTTGPAILIDALAIALGFGVLILSQVPANTHLGGLVAMSVLSCLLWTVVLLPALMVMWPPRTT